jgi:Sulfotransferase family
MAGARVPKATPGRRNRGNTAMTDADRAAPRPILVTGAHRSGSTWVGRMIARSPNTRYIHEPFNPDAFRPGICAARFEREFAYVCPENAASCEDDLRRCLEFRYRLAESLRAVRSAGDAARTARDLGRFAFSRWRRARPVVKDPHAVFSAEWLAPTFRMDVVVIIRHPAAFVGSLKKARWEFRFEQFLEQPLLMQHHLSGFRTEIEALATRKADIVDQGILLWNVIYDVIRGYRNRHPDWIFVRHEDLSREPLSAFFDIFQRLGLECTGSVRRAIADFSGPHNPGEQHSGGHIRRDSASNIWNWKKRLTPEEIERVRERTEAIADRFYSDEDWQR